MRQALPNAASPTKCGKPYQMRQALPNAASLAKFGKPCQYKEQKVILNTLLLTKIACFTGDFFKWKLFLLYY